MSTRRSARQNRSILVVEDNEDMRTLLGQILARAGYRALFAGDGSMALLQAQHSHPHLILMDLSLPGMSGWEAVEQLRRLPEFASTPIIAVTAHASSADMERAIAVGCTVHLGKPFDCGVSHVYCRSSEPAEPTVLPYHGLGPFVGCSTLLRRPDDL